MDLGSDLSWIGISMKIFFIDVLLGGDNALVIALACRGLPSALVPRAVALGAAGAIVFRVLIAATAGALLAVPALKIVSGLLLLVIAVNLLVGEHMQDDGGDTLDVDASFVGRDSFVGAAFVILVVDAIMSLDNVVALAAVSEGNFLYLAGGLIFSVPFLFWGSLVVSEAMRHFPALVMVGSALLGWVAGELIVSDPLWAGWMRANAEAASVCLPLACAAFVILEARITADARLVERRARPVRAEVAPARARARLAAAGPGAARRATETPSRVAVPSMAAMAPSPLSPSRPAMRSDSTVTSRRGDAVVLIGLLCMVIVVTTIFIVTIFLSNAVDP